MRIALVSPYSWTYPGGVTRHIEALAGEFGKRGHEVRVLAPFDPPDNLAARLHRGHAPQQRDVPPYLVPLGRTIGFPANGAVSNLSATPTGVQLLREELATGGYDVVHIHEPVAPTLGWDALCSTRVPLVGTFHCYSENKLSNGVAVAIGARRRLNRLAVRIAVSEAAAWTGRRFFGGRYRIIPNGVDVPSDPLALRPPRDPADPTLRLVFVGQAVERKGLPVLLRAFEALREHVPATLTLVGPTPEDVEPVLVDARGVTALGRVDDPAKIAALRDADLLCAPSLGGESFGMVLTEGFAAGCAVVASDIAGYRDVLRDGVDGVLFPRGDATALAETLRDLALDPGRRARMAAQAAEHAQRFAWTRVADEVLDAYEDAIAAPQPEGRARRVATRVGAVPADGLPRIPAMRLPTLEPAPAAASGRGRVSAGLAVARKAGVAAAGLGVAGLGAVALERIGVDRIAESLVRSSPPWVLLALGLMCLSMVVRGLAWHQILKACLGPGRTKRRDALQGTFIGVLMSATLPARLGEPARAMVVARRSGRPREALPTVLGTLVSQTLLNLVALVLLGSVMFSTVHYFDGHHTAFVLFALAPIAVVAVVAGLPSILRGDGEPRSRLLRRAGAALNQVRGGLAVFRRPREGAFATLLQLSAWVIQWLSCWVLLLAFNLDAHAGLGAAAAVLFAVNVTAVLPATPSNLGVFQFACVAVLHNAYGVSSADALGYGIVLQAVEVATALVMGIPALLAEGLSWKDVKLRALHYAPVELKPVEARRGEALEIEA